jgi:N-acetylmuramoyl-L-alanine amidase
MGRAWTSAFGIWWARRLLAAALWLFAGTIACADPSSSSGRAAILGVRFGGDGNQTRMVVESDRSLSSLMSIVQEDSRHIVVSLPRVSPPIQDNNATQGLGFGFVKAWRVEADARGSRLLIYLTCDCLVSHRFGLGPLSADTSYRYVIDIAPMSKGSGAVASSEIKSIPPGRSLREESERPAVASRLSTSRSQPSARRARKVIVVDAGHGGHDPGAQAADLSEKDITLATALALRKRLERGGRYKVVMTRDSDVFIPLATRVQVARRAGADLFISLHADSAGSDSDTHGASVYTLSDHGETRVAEVLGQGEWFARPGDRASDPAVGRILLIDRVSDKIDLLPRTHRDAGYFVLLAPDVPAVLLEMGFISSPRDQIRLTDVTERTKLADAIGQAIDAYFDSQPDIAPTPHRTKAVVQAHTIKSAPQLPATQSG